MVPGCIAQEAIRGNSSALCMYAIPLYTPSTVLEFLSNFNGWLSSASGLGSEKVLVFLTPWDSISFYQIIRWKFDKSIPVDAYRLRLFSLLSIFHLK